MIEVVVDGYTLSTDIRDMDVDLIQSELSDSYWARGVPREIVIRSLAHSLCFAAFDPSARQVAFARAITDTATFAYIADVFVVKSCQGQGIGTWLMAQVIQHPQLQGLRRMLLATRDAHGLYRRFGFTPLTRPDIFMEVWNPDVYPPDPKADRTGD